MLCICFLIGFLHLASTVYGQVGKTASACFNVAGCDTLHLNCSNGRRIFIKRILYGFKPSNSMCRSSPSCGDCCCVQTGDSFQDYSEQDFGLVYTKNSCWNRESCTSPAQQGDQGFSKSTFALVLYNCLRAGDITDFHRKGSITAPAVAINYNASDVTNYPLGNRDNRTWHCLVNKTDLLKPSVDVTVVRESNSARSTNTCTSVGWISHTEEFLPCSPEFRYRENTLKAPLHISVRVHVADRLSNGWTVVRSLDGSDLVVTCGILDSVPITSSSSSGNTSTASPTITTSPDSSGSSLPSTRNADDTSTGNGNSSQGGTDTGAVAGGVVAAVVVLIAIALEVFCFVKRSRSKSGTRSTLPRAGKSSTNMHSTSVTSRGSSRYEASNLGITNAAEESMSNTTGPVRPTAKPRADAAGATAEIDQLYAKVNKEPKSDNAAASGIHSNRRNPVEEPDYDSLGGKKPHSSSSNPAATYGRLGEVGGGVKDTDYSYDHLARGRQAVPDVIDSDYDTAKLHMTSEGDYTEAWNP